MGRRRRRRKYLILLSIILLFAVLSAAVLVVDHSLRPVLIAVARMRVEGLGTSVLAQVVREEAASQISYSDLIDVKTTEDGYVSYMMPDTGRIMETVGRVGVNVQRELDELSAERLAIPMGQVTGVAILANVGPDLPLEILPMGAAEVEVEEEFTAVGINHLRHTIFLKVRCDLMVAAPLIQNELQVSVKLPVAEAVVVGPVPDMYLPLGMLPSFPGAEWDFDNPGIAPE